MDTNVKTVGSIVLVALVVATVAFGVPVLASGSRDAGPVESIHGIAFPSTVDGIRVLETLAHVDVYLTEPVLAKRLELTVTFDPKELAEVRVGVRRDGFWLSYEPVELWNASLPRGMQTQIVSFSLTDVFQEPNQSIDVLFFATPASGAVAVDASVADPTDWVIESVSAHVATEWPTVAQVKDYARAVVTRERAL